MNNKQKILYFLGPTAMSGAAISFINMIDNLRNVYEIVVAVSNKNINNDLIDYLTSLGISVTYFNAESLIYPIIRDNHRIYDFCLYPYKILKKIYRIHVSKRDIKRIISNQKPDLIHTNVGVLYQVISVANSFGIPHVLHIREYQTKDFGWKIFPFKMYYKSQLKKSYIISITKDIFSYFQLGDHDKAYVIYDGILSKNAILFNPVKDKYFLCASRISEEKGIESAINAFDQIADQIPSYSLVIAGGHATEEYYDKIKKLIDSKNNSAKIKLLGYRDDVVELMKNASALIVGSRFEGLGRMTVEATFAGCLVIGRNSGGTKEVLELTQGGFLFDTDTQLANLLIKVASMSCDDYQNMIRISQKVAVEKFSNEVFCEELLNKYNHIIDVV